MKQCCGECKWWEYAWTDTDPISNMEFRVGYCTWEAEKSPPWADVDGPSDMADYYTDCQCFERKKV